MAAGTLPISTTCQEGLLPFPREAVSPVLSTQAWALASNVTLPGGQTDMLRKAGSNQLSTSFGQGNKDSSDMARAQSKPTRPPTPCCGPSQPARREDCGADNHVGADSNLIWG